jgi:hypothetical protein
VLTSLPDGDCLAPYQLQNFCKTNHKTSLGSEKNSHKAAAIYSCIKSGLSSWNDCFCTICQLSQADNASVCQWSPNVSQQMPWIKKNVKELLRGTVLGGGGGHGRRGEVLCYKTERRGFHSRWGHWIFNWSNPSNRTSALGSTQLITEISTRNLPGGKGWPLRKADSLTVICEPIIYKMWGPQRLTTLWASTAC